MSATTSRAREEAAHDTRIGPFRIDAAENALGGRAWSTFSCAAMVGPETVTDRSQGAQLDRFQELMRHVRGD